VDLDVENLPMDDQPTFELLNRGDTVGVFQVESKGMRDMLRKIGVGRFEDLIALIALFRPGPMQFLDNFGERKNGRARHRIRSPAAGIDPEGDLRHHDLPGAGACRPPTCWPASRWRRAT
jgi:DNA polymerase III alpha subunit